MQVKRMPVTRRRCNGYFFALKSLRLLSCRDVLAWYGRHGTDMHGTAWALAQHEPCSTPLPDPNLGPGPQIASCLSDCLRLPYGNLTVTKGPKSRHVPGTSGPLVCFAYAQVGRELGSLSFNETFGAN